MTRSARFLAVAVLSAVVGSASSALAADQPIAASELLLQVKPDKQKLSFVSKDPSVLFPTIGGPDDPTIGSGPGGAVLDLFVRNDHPTASFDAPRGTHVPLAGAWWKAGHDSYRFTGKNTQLKIIVLKQGKLLKVKGRVAGLPLGEHPNGVAVRITTGSLRSCAIFGPDTILTTDANEFHAKNAPTAAVADCDDETLRGTLPCGASHAEGCNGECPAGEECRTVVYFGQCGCVPIGSLVCGGGQCGGACPSGLSCQSVPIPPPLGGTTCDCAVP